MVRVSRVPATADEAENGRGVPRIQVVTGPMLLRLVTQPVGARWFRDTPNGDTPAMPSKDVVQAILHAGEWPAVRPLTGILETPAIRADGTVLQVAGYDRATGYFLEPTIDFPNVPEEPTQEDASLALAALREVFQDFPYVNEAARDVPIAALLSILARPAIGDENTPAFIFEASTKGAGKSLQIDAICTIATGRSAAKMTYPSKDEELSKMLDSHARGGSSLLVFDNVDRAFGGASLDKAITCNGSVAFRLLGQTAGMTVKWGTVVMASANNATYGGDMSRRMLVSRIEPQCESPETRSSWLHPNLLRWVEMERGRLVVAGLTILRAHVVARMPAAKLGTFGSFEAWTHRVADAIVFAGGANVLMARAAADDESVDPERADLRALLAAWPKDAETPARMTTRELFEAATAHVPRQEGSSFEGPPKRKNPGLEEVLDKLAPKPRPGERDRSHTLAYRLRKWRGWVVDGFKLTECGRDSRTRSVVWAPQAVKST